MVKQYLEHSRKILTSEYSLFKGTSNEIPIISLFGYQNEYDLRKGFPLLTTKKMGIKTITQELMWFMRGETNIKSLVDNKVSIWTRDAFNRNLEQMSREGIFPGNLIKYSSDWEKAISEYEQRIKESSEFANRFGDLGPVYGVQWRNWKSVGENGEIIEIDQFEKLMEILRKRPTSKKNIITSWNPGELSRMALEPCHLLFQVNSDGEVLDLQMYQRSCDQFLGVPFNIASYAMLTRIIAQQTGLEPRRFVHAFGDSHFYCGSGERGRWYGENFERFKEIVRSVKNPADYLNVLEDLKKISPPETKGKEGYDHVTAILEQMSREPRNLPVVEIAKKDYNKLKSEDVNLIDYNPHPSINRRMAV